LPHHFASDTKSRNWSVDFLKNRLHQKLKPRAILALNPAGFGDMLRQINKFLWVCDFYGYRSKVFFDDINERNEITVSEFFDKLNITNDNLLSDYFDFNNCVSFTRFLEKTKGGKNPFSTFYFRFDPWSYNTAFNPELQENFQIQHPRILDAIKNSEFYAELIRIKEAKPKPKICVHVRRGDTARVQAADVKSIINDTVSPDKFLLTQGVFLPYWMEKKVSPDFLKRFKPIADYQAKLKEIKNNSPHEYEVILVSDGMTKLAQSLKENYNYIFKDCEICVLEIENTLNVEFDPLLKEVDEYWIGEKRTFWKSIMNAASSDIVISNSPAFVKQVTKGLNLDIQFVKP